MSKIRIPYYSQERSFTCGAACLRMVLGAFGLRVSERSLASQAHVNKHDGMSAKECVSVLRQHGILATVTRQMTKSQLFRYVQAGSPLIVNYRIPGEEVGHYALAIGGDNECILLADPALGARFSMPWAHFYPRWLGHNNRLKNRGRAITIHAWHTQRKV